MEEVKRMGSELEKTENTFVSDIKKIIQEAQIAANGAVSAISVVAYWNVGKRIVEQEQKGEKRAEYGEHLIDILSEELVSSFGKSYGKRNLQYFRKFYLLFPDAKIVNACVHNLTWTHFRSLLTVTDENARLWYAKEASEQMWSSRTLDRNIGTQYYERLLLSPKKEKIIAEMKRKTENFKSTQYELLKSPLIAEFLGFNANTDYSESSLESAIITHIRDFLMEMGKGFAFVARQQHIVTESDDYFIDLVFYNIELKCYVLIDLKIGKITHQDIGQMGLTNKYCHAELDSASTLYTVHRFRNEFGMTLRNELFGQPRMYDDLKRKSDDNPTIGIVLCSQTDSDIARYSILHDSKQIFMAKYMTYMPTQEALKNEIEKEKSNFYLQHPELKQEENETEEVK